jgi:hypothetical protein
METPCLRGAPSGLAARLPPELKARRKTGILLNSTAIDRVLGQWNTIRKSGNRFSEKIMLKQIDEILIRFRQIGY